jgi:hypothetical protein
MPYYKFDTKDYYVNTVKTYPTVKFVIYSGSAFYNNAPNISGAVSDPIRLTDAGHISLYELNIDRVESDNGYISRAYDSAGNLIVAQSIANTGLIYPWVVKNGTRIAFRTTATASWIAADYGTVISSSYPLTSSISKEYYSPLTPRSASQPALYNGYVSHLLALKNTIDSYRYLNPHYTYLPSGSVTRNLHEVDVGLVSIPTIFYGSQIKKGTIDLKYYFTGSLIGRAQDTYQNGMLYETLGTNVGSLVGFALYNEGFLVLTGSHNLSNETDYYTSSIGGNPAVDGDNPSWIYFAQSLSASIIAPSSSYIMEMSGTNYTPTLTMFATAPKGELNQSSNPTFIKYTEGNYAASGEKTYLENNKMEIKNIVSSSYNDPTGSFEKTIYISKIGVYDKNQNLIGIAKVATPVKKTTDRDFTFKIRLDL